MKLAIICAMDEELSQIDLELGWTPLRSISLAGNIYNEYFYAGHSVISTKCGIGKVNAAIATQALLANFAIDYVVNVGIAGSLSKELKFGDVVIADDLVEHDFDMRSFGVPLGQIVGINTFSFAADSWLKDVLLQKVRLESNQVACGRIVSGDQFIDNAAKAEFLHSEFNALACEMEGAAIAHVCYANQIPFAVIRSLSDMAGQDGNAFHSFTDLKEMAAKRAALVVKNLLREI
ncbi:MAG TPA: 5'-methylthioadenosine/adenosylhomocysteine nucleosidase [Burkholderiales bacterium]|nr:5'-methylthioadenosine/adenosylhomocysteine nucleosidase [Burkholderiales bacterium]